MSEAEVEAAFSEVAQPAAKPSVPQYKGSDFKGALLTDERCIIYTEAEFRTGKNGHEFYMFHNPFGRTLVFPKEVVLETDIEGIVKDHEVKNG